MILLTKDLFLYDTDTFGMDGWGTNHQESIDYDENSGWYYHVWIGSYHSEYEDVNEDYPLEVIKTFNTIGECRDFISKLQDNLANIEKAQDVLENWSCCMGDLKDE